MKELWTEKYAPKTLSDYVFTDLNQKAKVEGWVKSGALPNSLITGPAGTGKSTIFNVLLNELNVDDFDVLRINASKDNGVDFIRESVSRFAETMGIGDIKYVYLDEADFLSIAAQSVLRGVMEQYSSVRYLLSGNYPNKIMPALHSRCEPGRMVIAKLNTDEYTLKLCNILIAEDIIFEIDDVDKIVNLVYPDLRRGISKIQSSSLNGRLVISDDIDTNQDYLIDMVSLFKNGNYKEARQLICSQAKAEEYEDIFRFMYTNLEVWADSDEKEGKCIITIRDGLVKHASVADVEINLSAVFCELELISKGIY